MTEINTYLPNNLHVTIGSEPLDLKVSGVFVHNGRAEIENYLETTAKPALNAIIEEAGADLEGAIMLFNQNAFEQTELFNQNVEEQKLYITEQAENWATAPIEENPFGSAKYWAECAKINYEEALSLADMINGEVI